MSEPYSLLRRAWLPVALADGRRAFIRPSDISSEIDGKRIIRIASGRPDCDVCLTEFLIGLLAVALPPADAADWHRRYREPPRNAELQASFAAFSNALELDREGQQFFQESEALAGTPRPVASLLIDAPGEKTIRDNADHFVKRGRVRALSRAGAAMALATLQTSAPSGGAGHRTSLRGGGPLSTLVVPGTSGLGEPSLWQRLWANVPSGFGGLAKDAPRIFPWLAGAPVAATPADAHPAQAFFAMPRRIRLVFEPNPGGLPCDLLGIVDDVIVTGYVTQPWGRDYSGWSGAHPLSPYYRPKGEGAGLRPLHSKGSRPGYRQWLGATLKSGDGRVQPARCVEEFFERAGQFPAAERHVLDRARLLFAGYAMDKMKPLDFSEALLPLIITGDRAGDEAIRRLAERWVSAADSVSLQLLSCVRLGLFSGRVEPGSAVLEAVQTCFWGETEHGFYAGLHQVAEAITARQDEAELARVEANAGAAWLRCLRRAALTLYDDAVPVGRAIGRIKNVIDGRRILGLALSGYGRGGEALFGMLDQPLPRHAEEAERQAS
ncbi:MULTISPECIES: type I-E CRISPR-associated protein Cse1/CasA [Rhodomicrobium]|uniref:type I-E CRISPR-associated protein Cse1/CasA n=1 Tax=Rhodomicrobium TaxID=1068 RepID=UPI000B4AF473|nr:MULTISPECIES: type I-E CRISPR-associated protein Cse1/CasA [Rhodomicrobium]